MINWIKKFNENKIPFTWNELKIGRFGYSHNNLYIKKLVDNQFVVKHTLDYLIKNENENSSYLWDLGSMSYPYDENEIHRLLNLITNNEDDLKAYYRWRWILVSNLLDAISEMDYVNALLEINEFWLDMNSPSDMPHQFQGMGNQLDPKEFYTNEHLEQVILKHREWLRNEKARIQ